jgi:hypothetical protein
MLDDNGGIQEETTTLGVPRVPGSELHAVTHTLDWRITFKENRNL